MAATIGVAIPCYKPHLPKLLRLLDSIEKQTRKPEAVVVSCSSMPESDPRPDFPAYSFEFKIFYNPGKMNASMNRNFAASRLTTDYVSFFDADDIMHPQRLEAISTAIAGGAELIVHNYETNPTVAFNNTLPMFTCIVDKLVKHGIQVSGEGVGPVHHGQPTVKRAIVEKSPFPINITYGEDCMFCSAALDHVTRTAYIADKLSIYAASGSWAR